MSSSVRRVASLSAMLLLLAQFAHGQQPKPHAADPLAAAPPDDVKSVYAEAAKAYGERRYEDAIHLFLKADQLTPKPAFDFNIGLAYEDMGHVARALSHYRSYLRRAPDASDRADVDARIARLEQALQKKGVQQVTILSEPLGARFEIDGVAVSVTPWTGEIPPGFHRLEVDLRGYKVEERSFDLPPGRSIDVPVTLTLEPPPETEVAEPPEPQRDVPPPCEGACLGEISATSWTVVGVGVASLVGALAFEIDRGGKEDAAQREPDQVEAGRLFDAAYRSQKWATAFGVAGGALFVTGGVLAILDIQDAKHPETSAWNLGCSPEGCEFQYAQSF